MWFNDGSIEWRQKGLIMKKIVILVCKEVSDKCSGNGCFKAFNERKDAFLGYDGRAQMFGFTHCSGCGGEELLDYKIEKWIKNDIDTIHLSTCMRSRCTGYEDLAKKLSKHFDVIGYTHGSKEGKKGNTICICKEEDE